MVSFSRQRGAGLLLRGPLGLGQRRSFRTPCWSHHHLAGRAEWMLVTGPHQQQSCHLTVLEELLSTSPDGRVSTWGLLTVSQHRAPGLGHSWLCVKLSWWIHEWVINAVVAMAITLLRTSNIMGVINLTVAIYFTCLALDLSWAVSPSGPLVPGPAEADGTCGVRVDGAVGTWANFDPPCSRLPAGSPHFCLDLLPHPFLHIIS